MTNDQIRAAIEAAREELKAADKRYRTRLNAIQRQCRHEELGQQLPNPQYWHCAICGRIVLRENAARVETGVGK